LNGPSWLEFKDEFARLEIFLDALSINSQSFRRQIRGKLGQDCFEPNEQVIHRSLACKHMFKQAELLATQDKEVSCLHLLAAIIEEPGDVITRVLLEHGLQPKRMHDCILTEITKGSKEDIEDIVSQKETPFLEK